MEEKKKRTRRGIRVDTLVVRIVLSVISVILAVLFLFVPDTREKVICSVFMSLMIAAGLGLIAWFFLKKKYLRMRDYSFSGGFFLVMLGIVGLIRAEDVVKVFPVIAGIVTLLLSVMILQNTMQLWVVKSYLWIPGLVCTLLSLVGAVLELAGVKAILTKIPNFQYGMLLFAGTGSLIMLLLTMLGIRGKNTDHTGNEPVFPADGEVLYPDDPEMETLAHAAGTYTGQVGEDDDAEILPEEEDEAAVPGAALPEEQPAGVPAPPHQSTGHPAPPAHEFVTAEDDYNATQGNPIAGGEEELLPYATADDVKSDSLEEDFSGGVVDDAGFGNAYDLVNGPSSETAPMAELKTAEPPVRKEMPGKEEFAPEEENAAPKEEPISFLKRLKEKYIQKPDASEVSTLTTTEVKDFPVDDGKEARRADRPKEKDMPVGAFSREISDEDGLSYGKKTQGVTDEGTLVNMTYVQKGGTAEDVSVKTSEPWDV